MDEIRERAGAILTSIEGGSHDGLALEDLQAEYNALIDKLLHAPRLPNKDNSFTVLPTELMYKIFEEVCSDEQGDPRLLSQVSKQWFQLARENAELWTSITIDPMKRSWLKHLELYCRHSANRPLDIKVLLPLEDADIQQMEKSAEFHRWRSLHILKGRRSTENAPGRILRRASTPLVLLSLIKRDAFPQLREFKVMLKPIMHSSPYVWSALFDKRDDIGALPTLSDLAKTSILSHLTVNLHFTNFETLLNVLSTTPGLACLRLSPQRRTPDLASAAQKRDPIPLCRLRELTVENNNGVQILSAIACPNLEVLTASLTYEEVPEFRAGLRRLTSLKKLSLSLYRDPPWTNLASTQQDPLTTLMDVTMDYSPTSRSTPSWETADHEQVYDLLELFRSARHITLTSGFPTFDWPRAIQLFPSVESVSIEQSKTSTNSRDVPIYPRYRPPLALAQSITNVGSLKALKIAGKAYGSVFCSLSASKLRSLTLTEIDDLPLDIFLAFIAHSPDLYELSLEAVYLSVLSPTNSPSLSPMASFQPAPTTRSSVQDLRIPHNGLLIIQRLSFPSLHTLRLVGVLQAMSVGHSVYHYAPREVYLRALAGQSEKLLRNVRTLDLCTSSNFFPIVLGFADILPHLVSLQSISLPRASSTDKPLVDVLIQGMLEEDDDSGGGGGGAEACPQLTDIYTQDYPQWDRLMDLLAQRNRTVHISIRRGGTAKARAPLPIECLRLPALPNPSIHTRLQMALAGKFPPKQAPTTTTTTTNFESVSGCHDCAVTGWDCQDYSHDDRGAQVRSFCERHRNGPVRITANS